VNFCSVSSNPGKTGTFFYTNAFRSLEIDSTYTALQCRDLQEIHQLVRSGFYSGISVSMPFKNQVHTLCTDLDASTFNGEFINTLKIDEAGRVKGFNTDLQGVYSAISLLAPGEIAVYGDGAMGKLFSVILAATSRSHQVFSRKKGNWHQREMEVDNIINCTSIGMDGKSSPTESLDGVKFLVDLVLNAKKLENLATRHEIPYFSGMDFYLNVFKAQFSIYTDRELPEHVVNSIKSEWDNRAP